jgi:hypothetical protein
MSGLVLAQIVPASKTGKKSFQNSEGWRRPVQTLTVALGDRRQGFSITLP